MTPKWRDVSPGPEELEDAAGLWTPEYEGGDYWAPMAPTPKADQPQESQPADPAPNKEEGSPKKKEASPSANSRKRTRTSKAEREGVPRSRFQRTTSQDTTASSDEDLGLGWLMVEEVTDDTVGTTPVWSPIPTVEEPQEGRLPHCP